MIILAWLRMTKLWMRRRARASDPDLGLSLGSQAAVAEAAAVAAAAVAAAAAAAAAVARVAAAARVAAVARVAARAGHRAPLRACRLNRPPRFHLRSHQTLAPTEDLWHHDPGGKLKTNSINAYLPTGMRHDMIIRCSSA